jgi:Transposase DDE domain group 1
VILLPANDNLQPSVRKLFDAAGETAEPPAGGPRFNSVLHQATSWQRVRQVVAKLELYFGELFPRVGFIATSLAASSRAVVRFYNKGGTAEQWIKGASRRSR